MKLNKIAKIRTGYTLRHTAMDAKKQSVGLVSAKDLENGFSDIEVVNVPASSKNFLENGNILVKARSNHMTAKVFEECNLRCIAASTLLVVDLTDDKFIPEYIALVINASQSQHRLKMMTFGSVVPTLKPSALGEIEVPVLDIAQQKKLIEKTTIISDTEEILKRYLDNLRFLKVTVNNKLMNEAERLQKGE